MEDIFRFLALLGPVVAVAGVIWATIKRRNRPQFIVGMPPNLAEQKRKGIAPWRLGRKSTIDQFHHKGDCFAIRLQDKETLSEADRNSLYSDPLRWRCIPLTSDRSSTLCMVVENCGARAARDYIMGIQFLTPRVHIVDIATESLELNTFYANREDLVENRSLKSVDKRIVEAYDQYMELGAQYGDMIFLVGTLEGGMYEMILLKIVVEPGVRRFEIGYTLDCSDGWVKKQAFFQGFVVCEPSTSTQELTLRCPCVI